MIDELIERANSGLHESLLLRLPGKLLHEARILDVGCGTGAWLRRLYAAGFVNLYGLDVDVDQVRFDGAEFLRADLNAAKWPLTGRFDLISAIEVIEHLDNLGLFLDNVRRHLADGGYCLITTPNVESLASRLRFIIRGSLKQFDEIGDPTHVTPIFLTPLSRVLQSHGLEVTERWGYPQTGRTVSSRAVVNWVTALLRPFLRESVPGDNLCLLVRHAGDASGLEFHDPVKDVRGKPT